MRQAPLPSNFSSPSSWLKQFLHGLNLDGEKSNLKVWVGGSEIVEGRLLAALLVLISTDKEAVEKLDLDTPKSLSSEAPLGIPTEVAALRTLIRSLCHRSGALPK